MWTEARGQNTERAHVADIKVEMKWTGSWRAVKEFEGSDGEKEI